ncbi:MAG: hypothetical protein ACSLFK_07720 [Gemmatimonadaceae bacterium]
MQLRRLSNFFTLTGVVVGSIAIIGYAFDLVPELPESVLKLVIYKLTFIGAIGLVIFGAIIGRLARKPGGIFGNTADEPDVSPLLSEPSVGDMVRRSEQESETRVHSPPSAED